MENEAVNFEIRQNDVVGRFAVASCDLEPGEEILSEVPFAYGPKTDSPPICLGCYSDVVDRTSLCSNCGWPVCNVNCESIPAHKNAECQVFSAAKVKFFPVENPYEPCPQYECITPLRVLLAMENNKEIWNDYIACMQSHVEERRCQKIWHFNAVNIVDYLRGPCGLDRFEQDLIHEVCGILDVNTFEARTKSGNVIRCLYPKASIFSHNCVTNIAHSIFTNEYGPDGDFRIVIRAAVSVSKGTELFARYAYSTWPTLMRRQFLKQSKYFDCNCARCSDPSELGTNMSTLKCIECGDGEILCNDPLDTESEWRCRQCANVLDANHVKQLFRTVQGEIEAAESLNSKISTIESMENIYEKYSNVLHPRHAYLTSLRISLAQLYGRVEGYTFDVLPNKFLERKIELCEKILENIDVIEPGSSRLRGLVLYELHAPTVLLAKKMCVSGEITKKEFRRKLQDVIDILEESSEILLLEPPLSNESKFGRIARQTFLSIIENFDEITENM